MDFANVEVPTSCFNYGDCVVSNGTGTKNLMKCCASINLYSQTYTYSAKTRYACLNQETVKYNYGIQLNGDAKVDM